MTAIFSIAADRSLGLGLSSAGFWKRRVATKMIWIIEDRPYCVLCAIAPLRVRLRVKN
jgi:hypothetical protein